ncbi:MAG TPA: hypothetical protein VNW46_05030 [Gemmatimonadaceae bacterium]|nr:hypothetical protein [Gemmatimonadaceae bacterium]
MAASDRPELASFRELESLVRHLGDELAGFRRRALQAEARLKAIETGGGPASAGLIERVAVLEAENRDLARRVESATGKARHMLARVRFLRQQQEE